MKSAAKLRRTECTWVAKCSAVSRGEHVERMERMRILKERDRLATTGAGETTINFKDGLLSREQD